MRLASGGLAATLLYSDPGGVAQRSSISLPLFSLRYYCSCHCFFFFFCWLGACTNPISLLLGSFCNASLAGGGDQAIVLLMDGETNGLPNDEPLLKGQITEVLIFFDVVFEFF